MNSPQVKMAKKQQIYNFKEILQHKNSRNSKGSQISSRDFEDTSRNFKISPTNRKTLNPLHHTSNKSMYSKSMTELGEAFLKANSPKQMLEPIKFGQLSKKQIKSKPQRISINVINRLQNENNKELANNIFHDQRICQMALKRHMQINNEFDFMAKQRNPIYR